MDPLDDLETEPEAAVDTDALDAAEQTPRLSGPGAKVARTAAAPKTDVATLGREKRRR